MRRFKKPGLVEVQAPLLSSHLVYFLRGELPLATDATRSSLLVPPTGRIDAILLKFLAFPHCTSPGLLEQEAPEDSAIEIRPPKTEGKLVLRIFLYCCVYHSRAYTDPRAHFFFCSSRRLSVPLFPYAIRILLLYEHIRRASITPLALLVFSCMHI